MPRGESESTEAQVLPASEVRIELDRDAARIRVGSCEIFAGRRRPGETRPGQVLWNLCGKLLGDEMVLIYGRPLDWTGPVGGGPGRVLMVENVFATPIALQRRRCEHLSGRPQVAFPRGVDLVAWSYGVVLVRGDDTPWVTESTVRLRRLR